MAELKFEIVEHVGVLSENAKGWTKELNKVSWAITLQSTISETGLPTIPEWLRA